MSEENIKREFEIRTLKKKIVSLDMQLKRYEKKINARTIKETSDVEKNYSEQISKLKKEVAIQIDLKQKLEKRLEKEEQLHNKDNEKKDAIINEKNKIIKEKTIEIINNNKQIEKNLLPNTTFNEFIKLIQNKNS